MSVPVVDRDSKPLMPCSEKRARLMIESRKATPFWVKGIFCIRLNVEPKTRYYQQVVVGIDPGSKKEGFTVKSKAHTYLNIQADAVTHVKQAVETRRSMRRSRRQRKTPYRANRKNRTKGGLAPSTKARWQWKLRICSQLRRIYPITDFVVEDIKAKTIKGKYDNRNKSFSPLEIGKKWFYTELGKFGKVHLKLGFETKTMRDAAGLKKTKSKLSEVFEAHCVDSWVLANSVTSGHTLPDNIRMLCVAAPIFYRRQLHVMVPTKGEKRRLYGGTRSCGLKRGSPVKHSKYGLTYVGGTSNGRISLHSIKTGTRLARNIKPLDLIFLSYNTWKILSLAGNNVSGK